MGFRRLRLKGSFAGLEKQTTGSQASSEGDGTGQTGEARRITTWWSPEIAWASASVLCVVVLVAVLQHYDGRHPPDWPAQLNLNTLVALLTSIAKVAYMIPVIEGLGQLRWLWFCHAPRNLDDFDAIDQACRGSYGGFRMLFGLKGGILGLLGAAITIVGVITSPVTQQVIYYDTYNWPGEDGGATATRATAFSKNNGVSFNIDPLDIVNAKRAVLDGAYTLPGGSGASSIIGSGRQEGLNCPSANCTWPEFASLGICGKVANITDQLGVQQVADADWGLAGISNTTYNASLARVNFTLTAPDLHSFALGVLYEPSLSFQGADVQTAALDAYIIYSNPSFSAESGPTFQAAEILLYWCTKTFDINVVSGNSTVQEAQSANEVLFTNASSAAAQWNPRFRSCVESGFDCGPDEWGQIQLAAPGGSPDVFAVEELTSAYFTYLIASSFGGTGASPAKGYFLQGLNWVVPQVDGDISFALGTVLYPNPYEPSDPSLQFQQLGQVVDSIATSLTDWVRSSGSGFVGSDDVVSGYMFTNQVIVQVCWQWLSFLLAQILLSAIFLTGVVIWTRKTGIPVLKNSSIATMSALGDSPRAYLGDISDHGHMRQKAKKLKVRIERSAPDKTVRLVSYEECPTTPAPTRRSSDLTEAGLEADMKTATTKSLELDAECGG